MATALANLPKYLVLAPSATVRIELRLESPSCEIDVELENPRPGRSFVLLLGHPGGPFVQRVRLAGKARIFFDPQAPGPYELLLANPQREPLVLHLRARNVDVRQRSGRPGSRPMIRHRSPRTAAKSRRPSPGARRRVRGPVRPSEARSGGAGAPH